MIRTNHGSNKVFINIDTKLKCFALARTKSKPSSVIVVFVIHACAYSSSNHFRIIFLRNKRTHLQYYPWTPVLAFRIDAQCDGATWRWRLTLIALSQIFLVQITEGVVHDKERWKGCRGDWWSCWPKTESGMNVFCLITHQKISQQLVGSREVSGWSKFVCKNSGMMSLCPHLHYLKHRSGLLIIFDGASVIGEGQV